MKLAYKTQETTIVKQVPSLVKQDQASLTET